MPVKRGAVARRATGRLSKGTGKGLDELAGGDFQTMPLNEKSQNTRRTPGQDNKDPATCRPPQTRCGFEDIPGRGGDDAPRTREPERGERCKDCDTPLSAMSRSTRQKTSKETADLNLN